MHITPCLDPQRVVNRYTGEIMHVPCGKCAACLNNKSLTWIQRLDQERQCWKYCLFFTLTYADKHLPRMMVLDGHLVPYDGMHFRKENPYPVIPLEECKMKSDDWSKDYSWLKRRTFLPFVSVYDVQNFVKRLRRNCERYLINHNQQKIYVKQKDALIRYYICAEYGSNTLRPHYHGLLFFSSEFEASYIEEMLRKSWKLGIVDTSFVAESNSSYVAKYVNCLANLPSFYRHRWLRPFSVCSKCPPIGTLSFNDEKTRKIFDESATDFTIYDAKKNAFDNVPLWRTVVNRLFPKLTQYRSLTHSDRVILYRTAQNFDSFIDFKDYVLRRSKNKYVPSLVSEYADYLMVGRDRCVDFMPLYNWFATSRRVCTQSVMFDVSVDTYVYHIEQYYQNVERLKLKNQYQFQQEYAEEHPVGELIGMDLEFLHDTRDNDIADLSYEEILAYQSYGIDVEKFFSDDYSVRWSYQSHFMPENTYDYRVFEGDSVQYYRQSMKTKDKNDYLLAHPEAAALVYK